MEWLVTASEIALFLEEVLQFFIPVVLHWSFHHFGALRGLGQQAHCSEKGRGESLNFSCHLIERVSN